MSKYYRYALRKAPYSRRCFLGQCQLGYRPDQRIGASGFYSEVRPGDYRRLFGDTIKTEWFEIRGSIAPVQSQKSSLVLTAAAGFSNVYENDVFGPIYADHIRTLSLTSDYRLQDNFGGNNLLTVNYRQGIDVLGASHRGDDYLSHDGASGNICTEDLAFMCAEMGIETANLF
ncbi:MAG: hypothetical protein HC773_18055 [Scytonema sp. CRU_2_7]|nr:hypothetical protein [Scytonema sp. CRU_2_7]